MPAAMPALHANRERAARESGGKDWGGGTRVRAVGLEPRCQTLNLHLQLVDAGMHRVDRFSYQGRTLPSLLLDGLAVGLDAE